MPGFTRSSAQRIANAVRAVERAGLSQVGPRRGKFDAPAGDPFTIEGTETLYYVPVLREYDENGDIVAIGDEVDPLATGHTLKPTWDTVRAI